MTWLVHEKIGIRSKRTLYLGNVRGNSCSADVKGVRVGQTWTAVQPVPDRNSQERRHGDVTGHHSLWYPFDVRFSCLSGLDGWPWCTWNPSIYSSIRAHSRYKPISIHVLLHTHPSVTCSIPSWHFSSALAVLLFKWTPHIDDPCCFQISSNAPFSRLP